MFKGVVVIKDAIKLVLVYLGLVILCITVNFFIWMFFGIEWLIIVSFALLSAKLLLIINGLFGDDDDDENNIS